MSSEQVIGRFAPSPTGPLHFGSLVAAVGSYCLAKMAGGQWLLRMEDLDPPRVVPGSADEILAALDDLGLHWDGEIVWQSQRTEAYIAEVERLREKGFVFDCACTRKEILLSAPHPGEERLIYPGTCRSGLSPGKKPRALRIEVPEELVCFSDGVFGPFQQVLSEAVGDFVLRRADGLFAYQLAVVVDDAAAGINQVVRGADLLSSTPRQVFLLACLGYPAPHYYHLPMALATHGKKISKRHGTLRLDHKRRAGELIAQALDFLGHVVPDELNGASPQEILAWAVQNFSPDRIPVAPEGLVVDDFPTE
jgi:glutamyl-Q tRNA(Asp) synthetase